MRNKNIDFLKVICSFLIVCIHIPFEIPGGGYFVSFTRIGVPIFLMISGYYYKPEGGIRQIKKIAILLVQANLLYVGWTCFLGLFTGNMPILSLTHVIRFVVFNDSPFSSHLWYLGAILYTLLVLYLTNRHEKALLIIYGFTPILLLGDLLLGKYSLLIFGREFPYIIVRNWLFVGIPFFNIGRLMREKSVFRIRWWGIPLFIITTIFERYMLVSHDLNATRDQYASTTFLAIAVFSFALEYKGIINDIIAKIGREYSTWIYIIHPLFITCYGFIVKKLGVQTLWGYIGPIIVFITSLLFVAFFTEVKKKFVSGK